MDAEKNAVQRDRNPSLLSSVTDVSQMPVPLAESSYDPRILQSRAKIFSGMYDEPNMCSAVPVAHKTIASTDALESNARHGPSQRPASAANRGTKSGGTKQSAGDTLPDVSSSPPMMSSAISPLKPPGNCTQDQWWELQQAVRQECKVNRPKACKEGDSPEEIDAKSQQFARCIGARTNLADACFDGGDAGHQEQVANLTRGLANCEEQRQRVPVPIPQQAPAEEKQSVPVVDKGFMEKMSELTGLTGAALILYLIVSEGSRLFPPRNLVPVP